MVGEVIADRYELEELVGSGGVSNVFRAHDRLLERHVAIKLLHEHVGRDREQVERFKLEARSVARLSHPNIVTVIDRGEREGRQFIVFEYVEGESLKQLVLRSGQLTVRRALEVVLPVARALDFAHRQGLVHRDVKPQNVLIPEGGEAKMTDFGIARSLDLEGLTQTGSVVGTSHYIAPEQARGLPVDERTDVYSLGTVLFELLTGEVPFEGDNFVAVALRHVNELPPAVRGRRPDVSPRLEAAVLRAMAKDPADRFASMRELGAELEACRAELGPDTEHDATMVVPAPPVPAPPIRVPAARRRRGLALPLGLAAVLALVAAGAVALLAAGIPDLGGGAKVTTGGGGPPPAGRLHAVVLRAVGAWDPYGTGGEHDEEVPRATDGDPDTYWSTEGYVDGLQKPGVGLVLDTGGDTSLAQVRIRSDTPGFVAEIKGGPSATGPFDRVVSSHRTVETDTTFTVDQGTRAHYVLIWITKLAHPDEYRAHLNEVTAKG